MAGLDGAIKIAGIKLVGGLLLIGALVGARIVTVERDGVEAEVAELEAVEAELAREAEPVTRASGEAEPERSLVSRMSARVLEPLSGDAPAAESALDPDRLVRCFVGGERQFTRAADCLSRGGEAEELD